MATVRTWLWRLCLMAGLVFVYSILPAPLDSVFGALTGLVVLMWLYNRLSPRFHWSPLRITFEKIETITLTHVLMGLILVVTVVSYSELVKIEVGTSDVETSITNLQNSNSDNTDAIKSDLDDLKTAIEANQ